jgi:hypothetical protein
MAKAPTSEDVARMILVRFAGGDARAGHVLTGTIVSIQDANKLTKAEIDAGVKYAVKRGWVKVAGLTLRLTVRGFAAM